MSGKPFHPQGFGQHGSSHTQIDYPKYSHLGKKVLFDTLPEDVQECVTQSYLYLWGFTDGEGVALMNYKAWGFSSYPDLQNYRSG